VAIVFKVNHRSVTIAEELTIVQLLQHPLQPELLFTNSNELIIVKWKSFNKLSLT
jgi:hypothetical protein